MVGAVLVLGVQGSGLTLCHFKRQSPGPPASKCFLKYDGTLDEDGLSMRGSARVFGGGDAHAPLAGFSWTMRPCLLIAAVGQTWQVCIKSIS